MIPMVNNNSLPQVRLKKMGSQEWFTIPPPVLPCCKAFSY